MRFNRSLLGGLFLTLLLIGGGCAANKFAVGDSVYAEWTSKTWYAGSIDKTCDKGFNVKFDDGDQKCVSTNQLVKNAVPSKGKVKVGTKVLAKWTGTPYYDAEVISITNGTYKVKYYDGVEYDVTLNGLRLDPRPAGSSAPAETKPAEKVDPNAEIAARPVPTKAQLPVGTKIQAVWSVSGNYWPGKIGKVNADGTFDVAWNDGTTQEKTAITDIRLEN